LPIATEDKEEFLKTTQRAFERHQNLGRVKGTYLRNSSSGISSIWTDYF